MKLVYEDRAGATIWVGDMEDAYAHRVHPEVKAILYLGQEMPTFLSHNIGGLTIVHFPLVDGYNSPEKMANATAIADTLLSRNRSLLIACRAGISRSPIVAVLLLVRRYRFTYPHAYCVVNKAILSMIPPLDLLRAAQESLAVS